MHILITGATGFIGSAIMRMLTTASIHTVRASTQRLDARTDWAADLAGMDCVIHTAARVHIMRDAASDPLAEFRRVNVEGTLQLARAAMVSGVKRFIFISSIKVNGEETPPGRPFTADDTPAPQDAYGHSKHEAEQGLRALLHGTGTQLVIIRPPLVYGAGVKGNVAALLKLASFGVPLPLGGIHNQRSLVSLDNLVDLITVCITHPAAANQLFLVSDGHDLSTAQLVQHMATAIGTRTRIFPFPPRLLQLVGRMLGKGAMLQRLCGSLQLDITKTRQLLGWSPPVSVDEGMARMLRR